MTLIELELLKKLVSDFQKIDALRIDELSQELEKAEIPTSDAAFAVLLKINTSLKNTMQKLNIPFEPIASEEPLSEIASFIDQTAQRLSQYQLHSKQEESGLVSKMTGWASSFSDFLSTSKVMSEPKESSPKSEESFLPFSVSNLLGTFTKDQPQDDSLLAAEDHTTVKKIKSAKKKETSEVKIGSQAEDLLFQQVSELSKELEKIIQDNLDLVKAGQDIVKSIEQKQLTKDHVLKTSIALLDEKNITMTQLISQTQDLIQKGKLGASYKEMQEVRLSLKNSLTEAKTSLNELHQQSLNIQQEMQERLDKLTEFEHNTELETLQAEVLSTQIIVKNTLKVFLTDFKQVNNWENQAQLLNFIVELSRDLEDSKLDANTDAAANLVEAMYQHLGEKRYGFLQRSIPKKPLDEEQCISKLESLFVTEQSSFSNLIEKGYGIFSRDTESKQLEIKFKNQIVQYQSIIAKIKGFPVKEIATIQKQESIRKELAEESIAFQKEIAALKQQLIALKDLYNEDNPDDNSSALLDDLTKLENDFKKEIDVFENKIAACANESDLKKRADQINNLQKSQQEFLANKKQEFSLKSEEVQNCIDTLQSLYNTELDLLSQELVKLLEDVKSCFKVAEISEEIMNSKIFDANRLSSKLESRRIEKDSPKPLQSISALKKEMQDQKQSLAQLLIESKDILIKRFESDLDKLKQRNQVISNDQLKNSPIAKYFEDELKSIEEVNSKLKTLETHKEIHNTLEWKKETDKDLSEADKALKRLERCKSDMKIIEERSKNPLYLLTVGTIIPTLSQEKKRIEAYDKEDPRIEKLNQMIKDFNEMNELYINHDLQAISQKIPSTNLTQSATESAQNYHYRVRLFNITERHLHNDKLEDLSDNRLNSFVQWIRKHILKPMEECLNSNQNSDQSNRFFTPGGTITEKKVVDLGNKVIGRLK